MHQHIYHFFENLEQKFPVDTYKEEYFKGKPVNYLIIDNFFPCEIYKEILTELKRFPEDAWSIKSLPLSGIRKESKNFSSVPLLRTVVNSFTSSLFLKWMKQITENLQIIPDSELLGAGLSSAPCGSRLGLHVDFNWNDTLKLNRKLNLLFYINESWPEDWGGELELWNFERTEISAKIYPSPNRLIFWEHDENLLHGFPNPIKCPSDTERQNLMIVYYTSNGTPISNPHKSLFYD